MFSFYIINNLLIILTSLTRICHTVSNKDLEVKDKGVLEIDPRSVGLQFFIDLNNTSKVQSFDLEAFEEECCLNTRPKEKDCTTMDIVGGSFGKIAPKTLKRVALVSPTLSHLNKNGSCLVRIVSTVKKRSFEDLVNINFNTVVTEKSIQNLNIKQKENVHVCKRLDEDSLNKCRPVDCDKFYDGKRPFLDPKLKICFSVPVCLPKDLSNPDILLSPDHKKCQIPSFIVTSQDLDKIRHLNKREIKQRLAKDVVIITHVKNNGSLESVAIDTNHPNHNDAKKLHSAVLQSKKSVPILLDDKQVLFEIPRPRFEHFFSTFVFGVSIGLQVAIVIVICCTLVYAFQTLKDRHKCEYRSGAPRRSSSNVSDMRRRSDSINLSRPSSETYSLRQNFSKTYSTYKTLRDEVSQNRASETKNKKVRMYKSSKDDTNEHSATTQPIDNLNSNTQSNQRILPTSSSKGIAERSDVTPEEEEIHHMSIDTKPSTDKTQEISAVKSKLSFNPNLEMQISQLKSGTEKKKEEIVAHFSTKSSLSMQQPKTNFNSTKKESFYARGSKQVYDSLSKKSKEPATRYDLQRCSLGFMDILKKKSERNTACQYDKQLLDISKEMTRTAPQTSFLKTSVSSVSIPTYKRATEISKEQLDLIVKALGSTRVGDKNNEYDYYNVDVTLQRPDYELFEDDFVQSKGEQVEFEDDYIDTILTSRDTVLMPKANAYTSGESTMDLKESGTSKKRAQSAGPREGSSKSHSTTDVEVIHVSSNVMTSSSSQSTSKGSAKK